MNLWRRAILFGLIAAAAQAGARAAPVDEIIAAEHAFAADTAARGGAFSFRAVVAPDAVGLLPDPATGVVSATNAFERVTTRPLPSEIRPSNFKWWPAFAGAARSGEIGFTTGPVLFPNQTYGTVFTVWTRQPDGKWKYYFDGGPSTEGPPSITPDTPTERLPTATRGARPPASAAGEVARIEDRIARLALADSKSAYLPYLTGVTRLMGSGIQPTVGAKDALRELDRRSKKILFEPLGSRASQSGDLVFTFGRTLADGRVHGGYTRIWQKSPRGWRMIVDQLQTPPPPKPAAPAR